MIFLCAETNNSVHAIRKNSAKKRTMIDKGNSCTVCTVDWTGTVTWNSYSMLYPHPPLTIYLLYCCTLTKTISKRKTRHIFFAGFLDTGKQSTMTNKKVERSLLQSLSGSSTFCRQPWFSKPDCLFNSNPKRKCIVCYRYGQLFCGLQWMGIKL